jgi:hypothetical protein
VHSHILALTNHPSVIKTLAVDRDRFGSVVAGKLAFECGRRVRFEFFVACHGLRTGRGEIRASNPMALPAPPQKRQPGAKKREASRFRNLCRNCRMHREQACFLYRKGKIEVGGIRAEAPAAPEPGIGQRRQKPANPCPAPSQAACARALAPLAGGLPVVAVLFADLIHDPALVETLAECGFAGAMLDTAGKTSGSLLGHLDLVTLVHRDPWVAGRVGEPRARIEPRGQWIAQNVVRQRPQVVGKDAPWITEPAGLMAAELQWLNGVMKTEKNVVIVISHDEDQRLDYIKQGLLGDGLE